MKKGITSKSIWYAPKELFNDRNDVTSVFDKIYLNDMWGNGSGGGSLPDAAKPYINFLQKFFSKYCIHSVVDMGCGDWQFSKFIDWSGISYLGIDVVENVISKDITEYQSQNISFKCINVLENGFTEIPNSDLVIIKDVFQHLSNRNVIRMINGLLNGNTLVQIR